MALVVFGYSRPTRLPNGRKLRAGLSMSAPSRLESNTSRSNGKTVASGQHIKVACNVSSTGALLAILFRHGFRLIRSGGPLAMETEQSGSNRWTEHTSVSLGMAP